ncbi:MAG: SH3 domain-containing protein, partial [Chloroflexi bacterium]|nr:SH3 domain-containing protein [Chloroflexota bacterium]
MPTIIGTDVSFWQDDPETPQGIDFRKMRASAEFVIVRAGQNTWVDPDFKINWRESKLAGLPRGAYWFYDSRVSPKRQAELWAQQFEGDLGELPLFADFEEHFHGDFSGWKHWYDFLERLKGLIGGKEIAIYTAYYYWRDHAPNPDTQADSLAYFHQYPLWIANYGATQPLIPKPWSKDEWLFWQYTDNGDGKLYGVESKGVDLNYFNGDLPAFKARFNLGDAPPPPPGPGDNPTGRMYRVTAVPSLKVREGPGTGYNSVGLVYTGETVEEINATPGRTWLKIRKSDGSLSGWSYASYLALTDGVPPTPPPTLEVLPEPVPEDKGKPWYRVVAPSLPVHIIGHQNGKQTGTVLKDDTLPALDDSTNPNWVMIRRSDGLAGWVEKKQLL